MMSIILAKEGEVTWIDDLDVDDLPSDLPAGIQIVMQSGRLGLRIDGLVGALPFKDGRTLRIAPKVSNANFFSMLFRAEGSLKEVERDLQELAEYSHGPEQSIEGIVARSLLLSAAEIMRRSPATTRVLRVKTSRSALGSIDFLNTVKRISSGTDQPVVSYAKVRTVDTAENRLITAALNRAAVFLSAAEGDLYANVAERWQAKFPQPTDLRSDIKMVESGLAQNRYGGPRGYYQKALTSSLIILGASGISLLGADAVLGEAVLINTADVYEKYLRNTIRNLYTTKGYLVTKVGVETTSLYTNGSYTLEPDIVVYKENKIVLLCDAKYKNPHAADHYQMQTYLKRLGLTSGILLCPNFESQNVNVREFITPDKTIVREIYLPLDDLTVTENYLADLVRKFSHA